MSLCEFLLICVFGILFCSWALAMLMNVHEGIRFGKQILHVVSYVLLGLIVLLVISGNIQIHFTTESEMFRALGICQ